MPQKVVGIGPWFRSASNGTPVMSPVAKIWWRRWVPACVFLACWFFGVWGRCAEVRLLTLTNFQEFTRTTTTPPAESVVLTSPVLDPGFPWKELIVSWNASTNVALSVEARPVPPFDSPFYSLGRWAAKPSPESPRESINGQRDARAEVKTDVLVLNQPARQAQVRLEMRGPEAGLKRVSLAFSGTEPGPTNEPLRNAWGPELAVPGSPYH
ncbi:MAG TPA: hypothetical protein DCE44_06430 [Verrucomicrobiales bacterium]|nr:hypothetical protein [Verrucomicrobiales bacterium]